MDSILSYGRFFFIYSHGLDCCPMKIFLDLIKSWESSHRLNLIMSLLVAISLLICLIAFCFFLFVGVDDAVHVLKEIDEVGITGEVTVVSPPRNLLSKPVQVLVLAACLVKLLPF